MVSSGHTHDGRWHRLHPLSPVVRSGRGVLAVLVAVGVSMSAPAGGSGGRVRWADVVVLTVAVVAAVVNWLVTRWKLDGTTVRIETGLVRRDSRQLPVARIQAVDLVRPFLARAFGLAELRVRLAGSSHADGRLAYLTESAAIELRARLLAAHHGLDPATPEPAERILVAVPAGRLLGSVGASAAGLASAAIIAGVALAALSPAGPAAIAGTVVWSAVVCVPLVWRQVSAQYGFTLAASPDGIRIRRGLIATVAETIPLARVQAVRKIEPLLWRPLGWCRLEVDVAGSPGRDRADGSTRERKALLPVGPRGQADGLLRLVMAGVAAPPGPRLAAAGAGAAGAGAGAGDVAAGAGAGDVAAAGAGAGDVAAGGVPAGDMAGLALTRPPRRARWKAPLSYHFLAAGQDGSIAVGVTGRLRRITTWVPLGKVQSVRYVQGPVQRRLGLATVHVDAAGRRVRAEFRDRAHSEAASLLDEVARLSRTARRQAASSTGPAPVRVPGAGQPVPGQPAPGQGVPGQAASVASPTNAAQSEA